MELKKHPLDFISFERENPPPGSHLKKNKINYRVILNNLPIPVSVWEKEGGDFRLVYLNRPAKEKLLPELRRGALLSGILPRQYQNVTTGQTDADYSYKFISSRHLLFYHHKCDDLFSRQNRNGDHPYFKEEAFRTIIEPCPVSIVITDYEGRIDYVNPKFVEVTGYTFEELRGQDPKILKSDEKTEEEYQELWNSIRAGKVWKGEFRNRRKNGELYYAYAVIAPLKNEAGDLTHFIAFQEDYTRLKQIEDELHQAEKFAALGKFAAYISHEIKTPLTSIKLNVDMLEQNCPCAPEQKKSFLILQKEIKRLSSLLKNVLSFSRDSSFYFSDVNLRNKIENIHEFIKPLLAQHSITLHNNTDGSYIYGDPQQLRSLFIHLFENSIESISAEGEIEITSKTEDGKCHIFVKDNGCGISNINSIYEPFYSTKTSGSGLGLPIAKSIVEKHNGILKLVSSKPGETIFEIILPARA